MENQHRKIKGYRELNEREIELMNQVKEKGQELESLLTELLQYQQGPGVQIPEAESLRWLNIGKTHLQQGLMAMTRAIAQPGFF